MHNSRFDFREVDCPVCGGQSKRFLGWRGGEAHHNGAGEKTSIVRCTDCSHQYPNPMPFPIDDRLDDLYVDAEEYFRGHDTEAKKQHGLGMLAEFEAKLGNKGRYLDVGCGVGENLWAAKHAGWEYDGVDPSPEFIAMGKKYLDVEGRVALLEDAKFPDEHFDAVSMSAVIEHIYEPRAIFGEIVRILKPGGFFWFDAPNEDGLYMRAGNIYMKARRRDWVVTMAPTFAPYHVQGFNPRSIRKLVSNFNLEIEKMTIKGDVWSFTGDPSLRKTIEYAAARMISWTGNMIGAGAYMSIWTRKRGTSRSGHHG